MAEDRDGNLWIGTFGSGAMKVAHSGFVTYAEADGLPYAVSLLETRRGEFCAISRGKSGITLKRFDGRRFEQIRPAWPKSLTYFGWGRFTNWMGQPPMRRPSASTTPACSGRHRRERAPGVHRFAGVRLQRSARCDGVRRKPGDRPDVPRF